MKLLALTFVFASLSPAVQSCRNNPDFKFFYAGGNRNCQNVRIEEFRRQQMCSRFIDVLDNCPTSCGICCNDEDDYKFRLKKTEPMDKDCNWIAEDPKRVRRYCKKWSMGRMVRDACPVSCDFCQSAVLLKLPTPPPTRLTASPTKAPTKPPSRSPTVHPTKSPTKAPTRNPNSPPIGNTSSPTAHPTKNPTKAPSKPPTVQPTSAPTVRCGDDPAFRIDQNPDQTCLWLGEDESRRENFCRNGQVASGCRHTCGICCLDDNKFEFIIRIGTTKRCGWLGKEPARRRRYCNSTINGRLVKEACKLSCNTCFEPIE